MSWLILHDKSFTFAYDAENRLVSVSGDATATFTFNGDGQRVKSVMDGETTLFVGGHYEVTNPGAGQTITKYYMAGESPAATSESGASRTGVMLTPGCAAISS